MFENQCLRELATYKGHHLFSLVACMWLWLKALNIFCTESVFRQIASPKHATKILVDLHYLYSVSSFVFTTW